MNAQPGVPIYVQHCGTMSSSLTSSPYYWGDNLPIIGGTMSLSLNCPYYGGYNAFIVPNEIIVGGGRYATPCPPRIGPVCTTLGLLELHFEVSNRYTIRVELPVGQPILYGPQERIGIGSKL
jgi:hypothetical protein